MSRRAWGLVMHTGLSGCSDALHPAALDLHAFVTLAIAVGVTVGGDQRAFAMASVLSVASEVTTPEVPFSFWAPPERAVPHTPRAGAISFEDHSVSTAELNRAFPDFNCDRSEGGRWRLLRLDFEALVVAQDGRLLRSKGGLLEWRDQIRGLLRRHDFSEWLRPLLDERWVIGEGIADALEKSSAKFVCPLGIATVLATSIAWRLALVDAALAPGHDRGRSATYGIEQFWLMAEALQAVINFVMDNSRFAIATLAATRWPVLDILAATERRLMRRLYREVRSGQPDRRACEQPLSIHYQELLRLARSLAVSNATLAAVKGQVAFRELALPKGAPSIPMDFLLERIVNEPSIQAECTPVALLYNLVASASCIQRQDSFATGEERCLSSQDWAIRRFFKGYSLAAAWTNMNFRDFPVFGFWRTLRSLALHRLELPFALPSELASAFRLRVTDDSSSVYDVDSSPPSATSDAAAAFDALAAHVSGATDSALGFERAALVSAVWGQRHAERLPRWLDAARRAGVEGRTLILCHDQTSLRSCRAAHSRPELCAAAEQWPRTLLSKLVAIAQCLRRGVDVLWLDSDAVTLQNPFLFLEPLVAEAHTREVPPDMLFSVEAHSWNCVVAGVFFMRASVVSIKFLAFWLSLYLERPFDHDQTVLKWLLGLVGGRASWPAFAALERLLTGDAKRADVLGTLQTPSWGSLDATVHFVVPPTLASGGILRGRAADVVVAHLVESWPEELAAEPIFADVSAPVEALLEALDAVNRSVGIGSATSLDFLRRFETIPAVPKHRFDCGSGTYRLESGRERSESAT
eukprot:TRINITY_DN6072_c0_g1_i2.p1 TRINITY_DN6072_c0_g1~~TRINITY_DN6072_c0_g1_i2.p1  ORF type:complete len:809 (+),score=139.36 TRINITY_DN6072_c0_g1_i2:92-2518(+)